MPGTDTAPQAVVDRREPITHVITSDAKPAAFEIVVAPARDHVVVAVRGELDLTTIDPVEQEVKGLVERGFQDVVLDLRGLVFFDSSGLKLLLRLDAAARREGFSLAIRACDEPVRRLLRLTGVGDRLHVANERPIPGLTPAISSALRGAP